MKIKALLVESFRSGTIASVAIVPLSPLFKAAGLRIGHYGPKFAGLYVSDPNPGYFLCNTLSSAGFQRCLCSSSFWPPKPDDGQ